MEQRTFVYIVKCEDESLYTGIAKDLKKRMREHYDKKGKGAKYTRSRSIVAIVMVWEAASYSSAARLEYRIKHLARKDKLKVIASPEEGLKELLPGLSEEVYVPRREYVMEVDRFLGEERA
ncbi:MAG: GIY-YIG nuclease family protein [Lachnospiraceae bacterium]|nr:GIY-YIG nuclease family protein [Lachnospiraceae bacterium]